MAECKPECDGRKDYTDGIFRYCACEAQVMNAVCGANIKHKNSTKTKKEAQS